MSFVDWVIKTTGKIADNFNQYKFYVKSEPENIDSSSIVSIQTFVDRDMNATVPCSFKWSKIRNGIISQMPNFRGNTYICQPLDIGSYLQAQITSSDPQHTGTCFLKLGPVKFDVLLKKEIQISLSTGQTSFYIDIVQQNLIKECLFKINDERIIIKHLNSETFYAFPYCMIEPRIQSASKDPQKINIVFTQKYYQDLRKFLIKLFDRERINQQLIRNPFLQIIFHNRKARDCFLFILKAFNTKRQIRSSALINRLEKADLSQNQNFNFVYEIQALKEDILKLLQINGRNNNQKRFYLQQNRKLQKQISDIVASYTNIIQQKFKGKDQFQRSFALLKDKKQQRIEIKLKRLQQQNFELKQRLNIENNGINEIKFQVNYLDQSIKNIQQPFQMILSNINQQFEYKNKHETKQLEQKLNFSFKRIEQLQNKLKQYQNINKSSININGNSQLNRYSPNHMQIQNKIDYIQNMKNIHINTFAKQKQALQRINRSISQNQEYINNLQIKSNNSQKSIKNYKYYQNNVNPQLSQIQNKSINIIQENKNLIQQNNKLKNLITFYQGQLQHKSVQILNQQNKYKKKIKQLNEQLQLYRRNNDVLNRSQHISLQMDTYHEEQSNTLKKQNQYLTTENQKLTNLCQKYLTDAKKFKIIKKQIQQKGIILQSIN